MAPLGAKSPSSLLYSLAARRSRLASQVSTASRFRHVRSRSSEPYRTDVPNGRGISGRCACVSPSPSSPLPAEVPDKNSFFLNAGRGETGVESPKAARSPDKSERSLLEIYSTIRSGPEQGRRCRWTWAACRCESAKGDWYLWNIWRRSRRSQVSACRGLRRRVVDLRVEIFSVGGLLSSFHPMDIVNSNHRYIADPGCPFGCPLETRPNSSSLPLTRLSRLSRSFHNHVLIFSKSITAHSFSSPGPQVYHNAEHPIHGET